MPKYVYSVEVDTDTREHAAQVIRERVCFEEDYGFDYTIDYSTDAELDPERDEYRSPAERGFLALATPTIERTYFGGVGRVTFADFAAGIVQDESTAAEIAGRMLAGDDPCDYDVESASDAECFERFAVADRAALIEQLALAGYEEDGQPSEDETEDHRDIGRAGPAI